MHVRDEVMAAVRARTAVDDREERSIERFLCEIAELDGDPFSERRGPVHVTTSGLILGPRGIVLHRHRVLGIWVAPGGHIDDGEAPWDAVLREATEETGLAVSHVNRTATLVHVDVHPGPHGHTHLDLRYLLDGGSKNPAPPPGESQEVAWFTWAEALVTAEPCMTGILRFLSHGR